MSRKNLSYRSSPTPGAANVQLCSDADLRRRAEAAVQMMAHYAAGTGSNALYRKGAK